MINILNNIKNREVNEIIEFIRLSDVVRKLVVIGKCATESATADDVLEMIVQLNDKYISDAKKHVYDLMYAIDIVTEGNFNLIPDNGRLNSNTLDEMSKGVTVYEHTV